jgi:L-amino acid N-acyltransferase YncA
MIIRRAGSLDARPMADLLNQIIEIGGTTAYTDPVTRDFMLAKMARAPDRSAWHIAEDVAGTVLGFQWIAPHPKLPPEAADIATFVQVGKTGLGTGSKLFDSTKSAARALGYRWINATIRSDNLGGLAYYQSRGFETWAHDSNVALADGQIVNKTSKRYDLYK